MNNCVSDTKINVNFASFILYIFQPVTQGDITGYQVHYNGTKINVNSSTTTITFIAPSLPDGEHNGVVMVMVIATNQFGVGPESDSEFTTVTGIVAYLDNICVHYLLLSYVWYVEKLWLQNFYSSRKKCMHILYTFLLHHVIVHM